MRFTSLRVSALLVALVLAGCEGATVPLGSPDAVAVDPDLLGTWVLTSVDGSDDDEAGDRIAVWAFNETEYYVEYLDAEDDDGVLAFDDTLRTRVFMTDVDGRRFANVQCINCEEDERTWFYVGLELTGGKLLLRFVDDEAYSELGAGTTIEDARAYVRARAASNDLYEEGTGIYERLK